MLKKGLGLPLANQENWCKNLFDPGVVQKSVYVYNPE